MQHNHIVRFLHAHKEREKILQNFQALIEVVGHSIKKKEHGLNISYSITKKERKQSL